MFQMKKQDKTLGKNLQKGEINNVPNKELYIFSIYTCILALSFIHLESCMASNFKSHLKKSCFLLKH